MKKSAIILSCVLLAWTMTTPSFAENFFEQMKKDWDALTESVRQGIEDIKQGKQDVEEIGGDAKELYKEFTGDPADEPRYDSAWVAEVQQRLKAQGYDPGPIDGAFGNRTSRAIAAFQQHAGIDPDGLPRPSTMRALRARTQAIQTAQPQPPDTVATPRESQAATATGAPLSASLWFQAVGMPGSCGIACFDALAKSCTGTRDAAYRDETAAIAGRQLDAKNLNRILEHYDKMYAYHDAYYSTNRQQACDRSNDYGFANRQMAVRLAKQAGHSKFIDPGLAGTGSQTAGVWQPDPSAAPGGGSLAEPPGRAAWPAPGGRATGGGLVAPAPPGLATQGGGGLVAPAPSGPAVPGDGQFAAVPPQDASGSLIAPAPGLAARTPSAPPAAPAPAAAPATGATSPHNAALAQQFGLRTAQGRPVVADFVAKNRGAITDVEDAELQRFFDLVLLGLNPHALDRQPPGFDRALCLANRFLSDAQKSEVLGEVDPRLHGDRQRNWKGAGRNEFEASRARQTFLDTYLPQIVAAAPQFPIEFMYITGVGLLSYDAARGGFPVRGLPRTSQQDTSGGLQGNYFALPRSECFGGSVDFLPFGTTLSTFWPIDPQTAEQQIVPRLPTSGPMAERQAFAGIVFSVAPAGAATSARNDHTGLAPIKVAIHSVALYEDPDLERLLHAFSLDAPAPSVLLNGMPPQVPAAEEVLLTKETAALLLLKNQGDVLGVEAWTRLAMHQASNDKAYYDKTDQRTVGGRGLSRQRQTFDPDYVPFFPAGFEVGFHRGLTPDQLARFKEWSLARAGALPDRLVLRGQVVRDPQTDAPALRLGAGGQSGRSSRDPAIATLVQRGYVPGQVVLPDLSLAELGFDNSTDILSGDQHGRTLTLVLPNLLKHYAPDAPIEQIAQAWGLGSGEYMQNFPVEVTVDLERVEVIPIDPAHPRSGLPSEAVALFARPLGLRYFDRNGDYAALQQMYDVAGLEPHQTTAPTVAAAAGPYGERAPLTAEVADLLIAKYLPDALTEAELHRILLARWHYETDFNNRAEEPLGGRFFVEGTPRPGPQERAALLVPFRDWTLSRAAAVPTTVTLRFVAGGSTKKPGPVQLATSAGVSIVADAARSCRSHLMNAQRESVGISSTKALTLEQACRFLDQATTLTASEIYIGPLASQGLRLRSNDTNRLLGPRSQCGRATVGSDVYCARMQEELEGELLGADVALNDVLVLDKEIVVPDDPRMSQPLPAKDIEVNLRIVGIRRATGVPPHPAVAALEHYEAFAAAHSLPSLGGSPRVETPPLELYMFEAQVVEARVLDNRSRDLIGTLELRERPQLDTSLLKVVDPDQVAAAPEPYGPDIVGLRLGMTFETADQIIREHMKVGRFLVADRAYQAGASTGDVKPFSSGRLYVSEDETDTIILFDEPPSAEGVVMAVVRQLNLPKGKVPAASVFARLRDKYGTEQHAGNNQLAWGEGAAASGDFRRCAPDLRRQGRIDIWREADGTPVDWGLMVARGSPIELPSMTPMSEFDAKRAEGCRYALGATLDTKGRDWDHLIMGIIDKPAYVVQFAQSKRLIEKGQVPTEAAASGADFEL